MYLRSSSSVLLYIYDMNYHSFAFVLLGHPLGHNVKKRKIWLLLAVTLLTLLCLLFRQVSYVKAIDWYLIGSFLFVFSVLVEYTFVLYVVNVHNKRLKRLMIEHQIQEAVSSKLSVKKTLIIRSLVTFAAFSRTNTGKNFFHFLLVDATALAGLKRLPN